MHPLNTLDPLDIYIFSNWTCLLTDWSALRSVVSHGYASIYRTDTLNVKQQLKRNQVNKFACMIFQILRDISHVPQVSDREHKTEFVYLVGICSTSWISIGNSNYKLFEIAKTKLETELYLYILKSFPRAGARPETLILFIAGAYARNIEHVLDKVRLWLVKIWKFHEKRP